MPARPDRPPDRDRGDPRPDPACPFCGRKDAEVISLFGTQAMLLQYRCRACGSLFEANKYPAPENPRD